MSRVVKSLASRARLAALVRPPPAAAQAREYAVLSAAAGGAAGVAALRAAGLQIGYGTILASSLSLGVGVYTYEMFKQAKERGALRTAQHDSCHRSCMHQSA